MKEYILKTRLLDRSRKLILTPDYIAFENKDLKGQEFTRIEKADIVDFRRYVERIVWYEFSVGTRYVIAFKTQNNSELKITLRSYFGASQQSIFNDILNTCWDNYCVPLIESLYDTFLDNQDVILHNHTLNRQGITLPNGNHLDWCDVSLKEYHSYFTVHKTDAPALHARTSLKNYESLQLWSLTKTILRDRTIPDHNP
ncbi:hypothetical protein [Dawidia soli]|uniref:Uncharacterized protein n=1 Tax=Dawidia soli TaxID=2782352 RepID=A0AAP2DGH9_9BACT|nr:hypothetical protein [Dawidia soli]MBT1690280.1 hypothetical protein [Dawidia soli]